jgi:hypothetical protein
MERRQPTQSEAEVFNQLSEYIQNDSEKITAGTIIKSCRPSHAESMRVLGELATGGYIRIHTNTSLARSVIVIEPTDRLIYYVNSTP